MKLLFDENLSPRLVGQLSDVFPNSGHVADLGLATACDSEIWEFAKIQGFTIVTKDDDFENLALVFGAPLAGWRALSGSTAAPGGAPASTPRARDALPPAVGRRFGSAASRRTRSRGTKTSVSEVAWRNGFASSRPASTRRRSPLPFNHWYARVTVPTSMPHSLGLASRSCQNWRSQRCGASFRTQLTDPNRSTLRFRSRESGADDRAFGAVDVLGLAQVSARADELRGAAIFHV